MSECLHEKFSSILFQFSRDIETSNSLLVNLEEEKSQMNIALQNQTAAVQQVQFNLNQDLLGLSDFTSNQSQDLDRKIEQLKQECEGIVDFLECCNLGNE